MAKVIKIEELETVQLEQTTTKEIIKVEETFVFYNLYRMKTNDGGKTFVKILTSSGKISQTNLDILKKKR